MSRRTLTSEQQAARAERKARFAALVKRVGAMSDVERSELASKISVINTEGHALSVRNQLLIALQLGNQATIVAGFRQWLAQGRCVRKGEHGASICVPCAPKANQSSEEGEAQGDTGRTYFVSGTVFDISQTDVLPSEPTSDSNEAITEHCGNLTLV